MRSLRLLALTLGLLAASSSTAQLPSGSGVLACGDQPDSRGWLLCQRQGDGVYFSCMVIGAGLFCIQQDAYGIGCSTYNPFGC